MGLVGTAYSDRRFIDYAELVEPDDVMSETTQLLPRPEMARTSQRYQSLSTSSTEAVHNEIHLRGSPGENTLA